MGKENLHISKFELEELYLRKKMPMSEIAKKFGCTRNSIAIKMRKHDIRSRTTSESVKLFVKKKKIDIPEKDVINLFKEGVPLSKISKIYGCGIVTIMRRLRDAGISVKVSKGVKTNIKKRDLENLYLREKLTTYQIAEKYGCCQATIWKKLKKFGIRGRQPHELNSKIPSKKELVELYVKKKLSTWEIEKKFGYSRSTVHRKLKEYGIKSRTRSESHIIYPRKDFSGDLIEKAYLIGFRIGDLRVRKIWNGGTIKVDCGSTKKEQIDLIKQLFQKYGHVWIGKPTKSNKMQVEVGLNNSFSFLLEKRVPNWITKYRKYFFPFLAGFIDAEGCIGVYGGHAMLQIGNYDSGLLFLIRNRLIRFGIECPKIYETDTSKYVGPDGYGYNENYWQLRISKKSFLLKLFDLIGSHIKHAKKVKDLKAAKINILERNKQFGG